MSLQTVRMGAIRVEAHPGAETFCHLYLEEKKNKREEETKLWDNTDKKLL